MRTTNNNRCGWARTELAIAYHDKEWGMPIYDDRILFEFLILEGAQAGLSWETILRRRESYRIAFDNFDPAKVAKYDDRRIGALLQNPGIIRNRLKVQAAIHNARMFLQVQREFGNFSDYVWRFVDGKPVQRKRGTPMPTSTLISDVLSSDLRKRGFKFIGSTICYAFMQAVGMVNDHDYNCFRFRELREALLKRS